MLRVVAALGIVALIALFLVARHERARTTARVARESGSETPAGLDERRDPSERLPSRAETARAATELPPGEIEVRVLDVGTRLPVADLYVAIDGPGGIVLKRTNEVGIVAWDGAPPGTFAIYVRGDGYGAVENTSVEIVAGRPSRRATLWVERRTTLRLRFAHDDGTAVGEVVHCVTGGDDAFELPGDSELPVHHDWCVLAGIEVTVRARCEDGYEAETSFRCERWPVDERTIRLTSIAPRGRASLRFEVVSCETGEPVVGADIGCWFTFGFPDFSRTGNVHREGKTDGKGIGTLDDLPTAGSLHAFAWHRSLGDAEEDLNLEPGSLRTIRLALTSASHVGIRGTCPDRPHATVILSSEDGSWETRTEMIDGAFGFENVPPGTYEVCACDGPSGDSVTVSAVAGGPPVRIAFPPLGSLLLDCRDTAGRAPTAIQVRLQREDLGGERWIHGIPEGGRFRLPAVSQGPVRLSVLAPGYRMATTRTHVIGDIENEVAITLGDPLPTLDVLLLDPTGAPVPGVRVTLERVERDPPITSAVSAHFLADLDGKDIRRDFDIIMTRYSPLAGWPGMDHTSADGWIRIVQDVTEPTEFTLTVGDADLHRTVRLGKTGGVTMTLVVEPHPIVRAKPDEPVPAPLLEGDLLLEWNGWPLRTVEEVPRRWDEPVTVRVLRDGRQVALTLPPATRGYALAQAVLPVR